MSDPFSVTGSAVGVVSLGLTVFHGIVEYYTAFKGQDEEIDSAVEKSSRLTDLLEALHPRLEEHRTAHPVTAQKIEDCILPCYSAIKRLEKILEKCKQESGSDGLNKKLRMAGKRAAFPFRRETLQGLKQEISDCEENLDTAMSILQM